VRQVFAVTDSNFSISDSMTAFAASFDTVSLAALFALSGAGLGRVLDAGGTPSLSGILTPEIIAALCGLAALALLAIPLKKRFSASG
jgi:tRNA1(Val) A37 N6-methylase TrmN6